MAKEYNIQITGHPSIYKAKNRKLKIYFNEPENNVNEETGILLLIPGFGAHSQSNVYKKMRNVFADKYNLITIQCDYFGSEFMQSPKKVNVKNNKILTNNNNESIDYLELEEIIKKEKPKMKIMMKAELNEDYSNFNDMGIMQAIDNISAVLSVIEILRDNKLNFNKNKIIVYGHSHGAYLSYLVNVFAPNLFSLVIDNSAWIYPEYLTNNRYLTRQINNSLIQIEFNYLAKKINIDDNLLNLLFLYQNFKNKSKIVSYHGADDSLALYKDKYKLSSLATNFSLNKITDKDIDGEKFNSTGHGLKADFLKLFDYTFNNTEFNLNINKNINNSLVQYKTKKSNLIINYTKGLPIIDLNYFN